MITATDNMVEISAGVPWLAKYVSGWQFGEQGILEELCRRLAITQGYEIGAGDGEGLPVNLAFLPQLSLFEIDIDKRRKLMQNTPHATIYAAYEQRHASVIEPHSCVVVDVDSNDLAIAMSVLKVVKPMVMMIEHYDRKGPYMGDGSGEPSDPVPPWLIGMQLAHGGFAIQQPWQVVASIMNQHDYTTVALSRVNGIYIHSRGMEILQCHLREHQGE